MRYLAILLCCFICTGCMSTVQPTATPVLTFTPKKIAQPVLAPLKQYDSRYGLDHPTNFRIFQENQLKQTEYILALRDTVTYYEGEIDKCNEAIEKLNGSQD